MYPLSCHNTDTVWNVQCVGCSMHCTICSVQRTVCSMHCTVSSVQHAVCRIACCYSSVQRHGWRQVDWWRWWRWGGEACSAIWLLSQIIMGPKKVFTKLLCFNLFTYIISKQSYRKFDYFWLTIVLKWWLCWKLAAWSGQKIVIMIWQIHFLDHSIFGQSLKTSILSSESVP